MNKDIQETLETASGNENFWWLNNGATIIASDAKLVTGKTIVLDNPEIVNDLQTSTEIFNYFKNHPERLEDDTRDLLVRIIVPESEDSRDKIIFATNNQTPIQKSSLRATDTIHRQIEMYFKSRSLYYDRRKNYYKNNGKKAAQIVRLPFLSQCLIAVLLQSPNDARVRPSTLLADDERYQKLYRANQNPQTIKIPILNDISLKISLRSWERKFDSYQAHHSKFKGLRDDREGFFVCQYRKRIRTL